MITVAAGWGGHAPCMSRLSGWLAPIVRRVGWLPAICSDTEDMSGTPFPAVNDPAQPRDPGSMELRDPRSALRCASGGLPVVEVGTASASQGRLTLYRVGDRHLAIVDYLAGVLAGQVAAHWVLFCQDCAGRVLSHKRYRTITAAWDDYQVSLPGLHSRTGAIALPAGLGQLRTIGVPDYTDPSQKACCPTRPPLRP